MKAERPQELQSASCRLRRADGVVLVQTQEELMSQLKFRYSREGQPEKVVLRPSAAWVETTHIRKGDLLYSVHQLLISSRNVLTDRHIQDNS